ncbi:MAG TPA: glycosyltransferase [Methylibium sp.]|uniref:glycosyltransferase family 2 protein n=1 Tax=Methylibium sp. TaxID=2067992 RepID=UPI002DBFFA33|nr:glycosyltransferase [Methylibium sp.]HEU4458442.1 glycosyltransferase [Methylibium sp.]
MRYRVVIPVLDQLAYTQRCVESLIAGGTPAEALLVIDNASRDDTPAWLAAHPELPSVGNRVNLGCGGAWTQGALLATDADWVVLLNNDIVACDRAMESMLDAADRHGLQVVSPSLVEGPLDYDFAAHAQAFVAAMAGALRPGWFHGVCFAVRREVFERIGFPDTDRQLGGREDVEFLVRCLRHRVPVGTVGDALLHHFGSITQKAIKQETGADDLGDRAHFYAKLGMGWLARKRFKRERRESARRWVAEERRTRGHAMHALREDGAFRDALYL